jgi:hypothetical protein
VHLRLPAQFVDISQKLTLVRAYRFPQRFIVVENGAESKGKHSGMLKAIRDHSRVVNARFLVQGFLRIVLADNDGEIAGGIKKNLISADSKD